MGFYCFADGGESNGWILAIFTTNSITTATSLHFEMIRACVDEYVWLNNVSIRSILITKHWFEDETILPVGSDTQ